MSLFDGEAFRKLTGLLSGDELGPETVPGEVVEIARRALVLEVLGARPGVRERIGCAAVPRRNEVEPCPLVYCFTSAADAFRAQAAMGSLRLRELREIAGAMSDGGIRMAPLKGMAYGLMFEDGGPTRAMADIDLLVPPEIFDEACELMVGLGYRESLHFPLLRAAGTHERAFVRGDSLVEVHQFFLRGRRITVDYDAIWDRTLPLDKDGVSCRRLSPEDTFLYHCFHMGMHEFALGGLRSVWELRRLILEDRPSLEVCARRAKEWGTVRITWCALCLLDWCFPGTIESVTDPAPRTPDAVSLVSGWFEMFEPTLPVRLLLERFVIEPSIELLTSPGILPRPVQLFRKSLLVDSLYRSASYLLWYAKANAEVRLRR